MNNAERDKLISETHETVHGMAVDLGITKEKVSVNRKGLVWSVLVGGAAILGILTYLGVLANLQKPPPRDRPVQASIQAREIKAEIYLDAQEMHRYRIIKDNEGETSIIAVSPRGYRRIDDCFQALSDASGITEAPPATN